MVTEMFFAIAQLYGFIFCLLQAADYVAKLKEQNHG